MGRRTNSDEQPITQPVPESEQPTDGSLGGSNDQVLVTSAEVVRFARPRLSESGFSSTYVSADQQCVIEILKLEDNQSWVLPMLRAMLTQFNPTLDPQTGQHFAQLLQWPTGIVEPSPGGYRLPALSSGFVVGSGRLEGRLKESGWFRSAKSRARLPAEERGHLLGYLLCCSKLARAVRKLHDLGLALHDISPVKLLVDPSKGRVQLVRLVETLVVPAVGIPRALETPRYVAPEMQDSAYSPPVDAEPTPELVMANRFTLAVHVYELLFARHPLVGPKVYSTDDIELDGRLMLGERALFIEHPTDQSNRPEGLAVTIDGLGAGLKALFIRAFVDGLHDPGARPSAGEWEAELFRATDLLLPCENGDCESGWLFYADRTPPKCPWCGHQQTEPVLILELQSPDRDERDQIRVVGWHGRTLHEWHVFEDKPADETADPRPLAHVVQHQGMWLLVNDALDEMVTASGNPVPRGNATAIGASSEVVLSSGSHARRASVESSHSKPVLSDLHESIDLSVGSTSVESDRLEPVSSALPDDLVILP